jgi:hypothetical protein
MYENFIRYRLRKQAGKIIHPRLSLDHLDFAAFFAISFRFLADSLFALAGPPVLAMSVTYWFLGALFFPSHPVLDVVVACPEPSRRDRSNSSILSSPEVAAVGCQMKALAADVELAADRFDLRRDFSFLL